VTVYRAVQYLWRRWRDRAKEEYEDFVIQFQSPQDGEFPVDVLMSPAGRGAGSFEVPFRVEPADPEEAGKQLFGALFKDSVRTLYDRSLGRLSLIKGHGLRIRLQFHSAKPDLTTVAGLPWEALTDPSLPTPLTLASESSVVRDVVISGRPASADLPAALRILAVLSNPRDLQPPLDLEEERAKILGARAGTPIEVKFLERSSRPDVLGPPTRDSLHRALRDSEEAGRGFHLLHFMGHGQWKKNEGEKNEGCIVLEDEGGRADSVPGKTFAEILGAFRTLRLIVLNSCDSARPDQNPLASIASALLLQGFPAVVAMLTKISDVAANAFSRGFFQGLAGGSSVEDAVKEGRRAIRRLPSFERREWKVPVLFLPSGRARKWPLLAITFVLSLIFVAALIIFRPQSPQQPQSAVGIDLPDHAAVLDGQTVTGEAGDSRLFYYLFVRDLNSRECYVQNQDPLKPDQNRQWRALAHFSGNPGQEFEVVAVAAPRPLKQDEWSNCAVGVTGIQSSTRVVRVGTPP
jgi:CHAT domain-containing protein